jgi:LytTr DNA-binding domain
MLSLTSRSAPLLNREALALLPVAGLVIGLAGPFASYGDMALWPRIAHFMLTVTVIGALTLITSYRVARHFFQGRWPLYAALAVDAVLSIPGAAIVYASLWLFAPDAIVHIRPVHLLGQTFLMALSFRAISMTLSWRRIREGDAATLTPQIAPSTSFSDRLPLALRMVPVLAVSAEDHYLRVHTPGGEALIHMALAAAIPLLPQGFQIHRSHWIARTAIKAVNRDRVELLTGLSLPISRHRAKAFAGWLGAPTQQVPGTGPAADMQSAF